MNGTEMGYCPTCRGFFEYQTDDLCSFLYCGCRKEVNTFTDHKQAILKKWIDSFVLGKKVKVDMDKKIMDIAVCNTPHGSIIESAIMVSKKRDDGIRNTRRIEVVYEFNGVKYKTEISAHARKITKREV